MPASCTNKTDPARPASCDEFCKGPETTDPNFIYMQHGQLHLGNFSASVPLAQDSRASAASVASSRVPAAPKLSWEYQLQVEGNGWIRNLSHGLPHTRRGLHDTAVESVDAEPTLLTAVDTHQVQVGNLALSGSSSGGWRGGSFYEITIAGVGYGSEGSATPCVYSAKYMVVPVAPPADATGAMEEGFLSVTALGATTGVTLLDNRNESAGGSGAAVMVRGEVLRFGLSVANEAREVVVDVRRAGRPCSDAHVSLV